MCCRYITPGSGRSQYNFVIPLKGCGTGPSKCSPGNCALGGTVDNIIIIQTDDLVQVINLQHLKETNFIVLHVLLRILGSLGCC